MKGAASAASKAIATVMIVAGIASTSIAATSPASAQNSARERSQIRRQQQLILRQQREIESNQRRIEDQREYLVRSPVPGGAPTERELPKGLLSGVWPSCPPGLGYNIFVGCVPYGTR